MMTRNDFTTPEEIAALKERFARAIWYGFNDVAQKTIASYNKEKSNTMGLTIELSDVDNADNKILKHETYDKNAVSVGSMVRYILNLIHHSYLVSPLNEELGLTDIISKEEYSRILEKEYSGILRKYSTLE